MAVPQRKRPRHPNLDCSNFSRLLLKNKKNWFMYPTESAAEFCFAASMNIDERAATPWWTASLSSLLVAPEKKNFEPESEYSYGLEKRKCHEAGKENYWTEFWKGASRWWDFPRRLRRNSGTRPDHCGTKFPTIKSPATGADHPKDEARPLYAASCALVKKIWNEGPIKVPVLWQ